MVNAKNFQPTTESLGPAMRLALDLGAQRTGYEPTYTEAGLPAFATNTALAAQLWELAERYHPEEVWLAESFLRGERSLAELERTAPAGPIAPGFLEAARRLVDGEPPRAFPAREHGYDLLARAAQTRVFARAVGYAVA